jgi:hypothetical protein
VMMFGLPAACLAMYHSALPERRAWRGAAFAGGAAGGGRRHGRSTRRRDPRRAAQRHGCGRRHCNTTVSGRNCGAAAPGSDGYRTTRARRSPTDAAAVLAALGGCGAAGTMGRALARLAVLRWRARSSPSGLVSLVFSFVPVSAYAQQNKKKGLVANSVRFRKPKTRTAEDMEDAHSYTTCRRDRHDW